MADENHENMNKYLQNIATVRYIRGETPHPPVANGSTAIPVASSSSSQSPRTMRVRRPDLSTGPSLTEEQRCQLSPKSQKISHPLGKPRKTALEIASANEANDTVSNVNDYEESGIDEYFILNRDVNKMEGKRDKRVEVNKMNPKTRKYDPKSEYRGNQTVDLGPYGSHKPNDLFSMPKSSKPLDGLSESIRAKDDKIAQLESQLKTSKSKARQYKERLNKENPNANVKQL